MLINLDRYQLNDCHSDSYQNLIEKIHSDLQNEGLCVLDDFLTTSATNRLILEAQSHEHEAYFNELTGNAYLTPLDETLPQDHVRNRTESTRLGVVAYDQISPDEVIYQVYHNQLFLQFLSDALNREIYHYECPLGKINYSVMVDKDYLRWHFDLSDFVVSFPIQSAESGGDYEYIPMIRNKEQENEEDVLKVLSGDRTRVKKLEAAPGSLVLFEGRYTLHRVSPIVGKQSRLVALLGLADQKNITSSEYLRKIRYGRS